MACLGNRGLARVPCLLLLWLCGATACIEPNNTHCGELLCAADSVCVATGCASLAAVAACEGIAIGGGCLVENLGNGMCDGAACRFPICGNNKVEIGEACDDGNINDRDGCAANCASNETCGNGFVDFRFGEQCDEGLPGLSGDGCNSSCLVEVPVWRNISPFAPARRTNAAMAYDVGRNRLVMFGGATSESSSETWEYDGTIWMRRLTPTLPPARFSQRMVYDSQRHKIVMFGGTDRAVTKFNDTWEYNGFDWTQVTTAAAPSLRSSFGMSYDSAQHRTLLYGGIGPNNVELRDTWAYDGTNWVQVVTAQAQLPPGREATLVFDAQRNRTVLIAGLFNQETWEFNGSDWTRVITAQNPTSLYGHEAAYDPAGQRVLFFGGSNNVSLNETWAFNGTAWSLVETSAQPSPRVYPTMATLLDRVLLFGGNELADTWELRGNSWQQRSFELAPNGVGPMVFDRTRFEVVLFVAESPVGTASETWTFDGSWHKRISGLGPSTRAGAAMAYDDANHKAVLFGGGPRATPLQETWTFDGATWQRLTTVTKPPARRFAAMVYDDARRKIVMFGGQAAGTNVNFDDTWEFDGVDWHQVTTTTRPPAQNSAAIAYDTSRHLVVLFAGDDSGATWTYDGANWRQVATPIGPAPRRGAAMAFDQGSQKVVLFGGSDRNLVQLGDTWIFDGDGWTEAISAGAPAPRLQSNLVYAGSLGGMLLFGGIDLGYFADTWLFASSRNGNNADACASAAIDSEHDGRRGCGPTAAAPTALPDPDCWSRCTPQCPPWTTATDATNMTSVAWPAACAIAHPGAAFCGDGRCNAAVEDYLLCPQDCVAP